MIDTAKTFSFGDFELDAERRLLLKKGKSVALNSKTFNLLLFLVEHRGQVLSKDDLLEKVWAGQFVEENNLAVQVSALRKIFGERKDEHRFIVTVPGEGYSFVAELNEPADSEIVVESHSLSRIVLKEEINESDGNASELEGETVLQISEQPPNSAGQSFLLGSSKRNLIKIAFVLALFAIAFTAFFYFFKNPRTIDSVAVLPFVNVGADPQMEYLSDGITESLINSLSQSSNLKVIARSSVFRYKVSDSQSARLDLQKAARELGVQAVLTGSVSQRGDDLIISVELVDTRDNTHVWGEQYNRKFADFFVVQKEIARDISQKLRVKLNGDDGREVARRYMDNFKAFESYMMGRSYIHRRTREDLLIAARYYEQAIKEDQNYTLAYTGLAEAYGNLGVRGYISPIEGRRKLEESARKAVLLDDNLAEAHVMLGYSYIGLAPYNFSEGDPELRRAIELSPSLAIAHLYLSLSLHRQGRLDEGLVEMLKARELDPFSAIIAKQVMLHYYLKRDYVRALEILRQANEIGTVFTTTNEIGVYIENRLYEEALVELNKAKQQRKDDPILVYSEGMVYAAQGNRVAALETIRELERLSGTDFRQAHWMAKIYAGLGEKDQAFTWLDRGLDTGAIGSFYKDEPVWDPLRADPRFEDLKRRAGL